MSRCEVVCDIGSNWRAPGEALPKAWERTLRTLDLIKEAGANTAKFQYLRRTVYPAGSAEAALVAKYEWPEEWLPKLSTACRQRDLTFLCTVFEPQHVPLLNHYVDRWKISSFEARRRDLLDACRATEKPLIVSTGTLTQRETWDLDIALLPRDTLLYCVSKYPASPGDYDLRVLEEWGGEPDDDCCAFGLSDHTPPNTSTAAVLAVAFGASLIETHVTFSSFQGSPDAHFARGPIELGGYVRAIREALALLGDGHKHPVDGELTHYRWSAATGKRGVAP